MLKLIANQNVYFVDLQNVDFNVNCFQAVNMSRGFKFIRYTLLCLRFLEQYYFFVEVLLFSCNFSVMQLIELKYVILPYKACKSCISKSKMLSFGKLKCVTHIVRRGLMNHHGGCYFWRHK